LDSPAGTTPSLAFRIVSLSLVTIANEFTLRGRPRNDVAGPFAKGARWFRSNRGHRRPSRGDLSSASGSCPALARDRGSLRDDFVSVAESLRSGARHRGSGAWALRS
jgi:hypothetical protein